MKWFARLHKWSLLVLLVCLFIPFYNRFTWYTLLLAIVFISGLVLFFSVRQDVKRWKRIYLWFYPVYTALVLFAFIADRIFFIIVMIPLWIFILPQDVYVTSGKYEIRSNRTIMGHAEAELYRCNLIFEKRIGKIIKLDPIKVKVWPTFKVIDSAGKEQYISIPLTDQDSLFRIEHD